MHTIKAMNLTRTFLSLLCMMLAVCSLSLVSACDQHETTGEKMENAADDLGEGMEDAAEDMQDRSTAEKVGDAIEDAGDDIEDAAE